jgi:hypothetical protein
MSYDLAHPSRFPRTDAIARLWVWIIWITAGLALVSLTLVALHGLKIGKETADALRKLEEEVLSTRLVHEAKNDDYQSIRSSRGDDATTTWRQLETDNAAERSARRERDEAMQNSVKASVALEKAQQSAVFARSKDASQFYLVIAGCWVAGSAVIIMCAGLLHLAMMAIRASLITATCALNAEDARQLAERRG